MQRPSPMGNQNSPKRFLNSESSRILQDHSSSSYSAGAGVRTESIDSGEGESDPGRIGRDELSFVSRSTIKQVSNDIPCWKPTTIV